jgi:hypothetical protein
MDGLYLTVVDGLRETAQLVGNAYPVSWAVEVDGRRTEDIHIQYVQTICRSARLS